MACVRRFFALFALLFTLLLAGCASEGTKITRWDLRVDGEPSARTVDLPSHLPLPDRPLTYVLTARYDVPEAERGAPMTLVLPHLYALASLRVDGHEAIAVDRETTARYRSSGMIRFVVPAEATNASTIVLELSVEHRWTQSAWIDVAPRIAPGTEGDARFRLVRLLNEVFASAGIAASLVCGLVYVLVFAFDRRRRAEGWFALEATLAAAYAAFILGVLQVAFGVYDAAASNVTLAGSAVAAVHFTHEQFGLGRPHRAWRWAPFASIASVIVAGGPFTDTTGGTRVTIVIMTANCAMQTYYFFKFVRSRPRPVGLFIVTLTWPLACVVAVPDFAAWLGLGEWLGGLRGAGLSVAMVSFSGFLALSRDLITTNRRADQLNVELSARISMLEAKNQEVRDLNDELRRQISARSAALADMFTAASSGEPASGVLTKGEVLLDRYRIVRAIGSGGMGVVHEAERIKDGKRFALKVLNQITGGTSLARFAREAQIVSQIDHRNVVSIVDVDVSQGGAMFIVMELVEGRSLEDQRERWGDVGWALDVLRQVAEGLSAIHERGIVHRDLKPGNILTQSNGGKVQAKIADFGIARLEATIVDATPDERTVIEGRSPPPSTKPTTLTQTGAMIGTPRYMAPEMITGGRQARSSADVFSFGVVAFQILTKRHPFDGAPASTIARSSDRRTSITAEVQIDARVAELLDRCLDHDPAARPSARDLADGIRDAVTSATTTRWPERSSDPRA